LSTTLDPMSTAAQIAQPSPTVRSIAPEQHPVRGRFNAWFFRLMDGYMHWKYRKLKPRLFSDLPDCVVDLGAGSGANFRYLRPGTRVIAVEPNVHMHAHLRSVARKRGVQVEIRGTGAEALDLPDHSVDAVVCSLVLCTVRDADASLREVRRVLRPGGRFVCIEHVAAPNGSWLAAVQRSVTQPWAWLFEGCHTHRDTERTLRAAGFRHVAVERFVMNTAFLPIRPQIAAVAIA
jgi:ubiquinone/menaquinone biosynthesis C-methylase UbiE